VSSYTGHNNGIILKTTNSWRVEGGGWFSRARLSVQIWRTREHPVALHLVIVLFLGPKT
jgi:hypothetical protein